MHLQFLITKLKDFNFAELTKRIRLKLKHDYMVSLLRLCKQNGEKLMNDLLKTEVVYIKPVCKTEKQKNCFAMVGPVTI